VGLVTLRPWLAAGVLSLATVGCTSTSTSRSSTSTVVPRTTTTAAIVTTTTPISRRATIVLVVPTTGPLEGLGAEAKEGLELALRHATEDGRLPADMSIRIKVLDEGARNLARAVDRSAREDDVIAIVAGLQPTTEATLVPVANRRKVALFALSWGEGYEPAQVVRVGPAREAVMTTAAMHIAAASPDASVLFVLGAGDAAGSARTSFVRALTTPPVAVDSPLISTEAPDDPVALTTSPLIVTGPSAEAFAFFAKARPEPRVGAPSVVVPTDAIGCGTRPVGVAEGTHCVSRGAWLSTSLRARIFVEDTAARSIVPSWATASAYDAGTLLVLGAGPIKDTKETPQTTTAAEVRTKLLTVKSASTVTSFSGVNGTLVPGAGFVGAAQVLRAEGSRWKLAESASDQRVSSPNTTSGASIIPATNGPNSP
jgi:ABC-type branched-subunit amino acid transport system substrate-binding protein